MQPVSYTYQPSTNPANHRYGYQGEFAEKDRETGFNHFELRDYDSRIGRWFAPAPYNQYISPYTGMGNNPIFHIDPSGGYCPESYYSKMSSVREAIKNISRNRNAMHEYWMQNHTSGGQSMNLASGSGMVNATCTTSEGDVIWAEGYVQALEYTVIEGSNYRSHGGQLYYTGGSPSVDVYYREVNSNNETVDMGVMEMSEFLDFAMDFYSQTATPNAQGDDRAGIVEKIFNDYFSSFIFFNQVTAEYIDKTKVQYDYDGNAYDLFGTYKKKEGSDGSTRFNILVYANNFEVKNPQKQVFLTLGHELTEIGLEYVCYEKLWSRDYAAHMWEQSVGVPYSDKYFNSYTSNQRKIGDIYWFYSRKNFNLPTKIPNF